MSEAGDKAKAKADAAQAKADAKAKEVKELADPPGVYDEEKKEAEKAKKEEEDKVKEAEKEEADAKKEAEDQKKKDEEAEEKINRCFENRRKKQECKDKKEEEEKRRPHEDDMETVMETMILSEGEGEEKWYIDDCYDCSTNLTINIHKDCCSVADWGINPEKCHTATCKYLKLECCKDTDTKKKEACKKELNGKCIGPKSFQEKKQAEMGCEQQLKAKLYKIENDKTVHWRKNG